MDELDIILEQENDEEAEVSVLAEEVKIIEPDVQANDFKYARALKTVLDATQSANIIVENENVENLKLFGEALTQKIRSGKNKINTDDFIGVLLNTVATNDFNTAKHITEFNLIADTTYKFVLDIADSTIGGQFLLAFKDINNATLKTIGSSYSSTEFTLTQDIIDNTDYLFLYWNGNGGFGEKAITNFMVIPATENIVYEKYGSSPSLKYPSAIKTVDNQTVAIKDSAGTLQYTYSITVPGFVGSIGNVKDSLESIDEVWTLSKKIKKIVLTGQEKWTVIENDIGVYVYQMQLENANYTDDSNLLLCNFFKNCTSNELANAADGIAINDNSVLQIASSELNGLDAFKAKLQELYNASTPVEVYYVLKEQQHFVLEEEFQNVLNDFKLIMGANNITVSNGSLTFTYNKNLVATIEDQAALIEELVGRVQALEKGIVE